MPLAGQRVLAGDFPTAVHDVQAASGTTASTVFVETLTGGTPCSVVFVAPTSGRVEVSYGCQLFNSVVNNTFMSVVVRTGGVIGSGTVITALNDDTAVTATASGAQRYGVSLVLNLTPGATYNVRQGFRVAGGTGTFSRKYLIAKPLP